MAAVDSAHWLKFLGPEVDRSNMSNRIKARTINGRTEVFDTQNGEVLARRNSTEDLKAGKRIADAVNSRIEEYAAAADVH